MKNDETIDSMPEIRKKQNRTSESNLSVKFRAIHPAEKRLYANGDFEGVRSIISISYLTILIGSFL